MIQHHIMAVRDIVWSLPFLGYIVAVGCALTLALRFVQFRCFFQSWKLALGGDKSAGSGSGDMSPFQAFLNALSVSIGNGALAGVATAVYMGGPGAAFWMFIIGLLGMALRFAEVFLGVSFSLLALKSAKHTLGGPFLYINQLPCGKFLAYTYAVACLLYGLMSGNAMQCNSIATALAQSANIPVTITAGLLGLFVLYVLLGGAKRIVKISEFIVPFKVGLFFSSMLVVLVYYWTALPAAFALIIKGAFEPQAVMGSVVGVSLQRVFAVSVSRTINASESGLGTAAVFYGNTGSTQPLHDGITSMLSTFISNNLVSCMVALTMVASGVWNGGLDGAAMVVEAYKTVFGVWGGVIVSALSLSFGLGVFVAYGYITRQCWLYVTGGRFERAFVAVFVGISVLGSLMSIQAVWALVDVGVAACLFINLTALLYLIPYTRAHALRS